MPLVAGVSSREPTCRNTPTLALCTWGMEMANSLTPFASLWRVRAPARIFVEVRFPEVIAALSPRSATEYPLRDALARRTQRSGSWDPGLNLEGTQQDGRSRGHQHGEHAIPGRERLLRHEREQFLQKDWPALRAKLQRLGLTAKDLNWEST